MQLRLHLQGKASASSVINTRNCCGDIGTKKKKKENSHGQRVGTNLLSEKVRHLNFCCEIMDVDTIDFPVCRKRGITRSMCFFFCQGKKICPLTAREKYIWTSIFICPLILFRHSIQDTSHSSPNCRIRRRIYLLDEINKFFPLKVCKQRRQYNIAPYIE